MIGGNGKQKTGTIVINEFSVNKARITFSSYPSLQRLHFEVKHFVPENVVSDKS